MTQQEEELLTKDLGARLLYYFEQKNCKEGIEAIDEVLRIIECSYKPEDYFISKYDRCIDYVVWCVLNDEDNKELVPEWYTND